MRLFDAAYATGSAEQSSSFAIIQQGLAILSGLSTAKRHSGSRPPKQSVYLAF